jgi:hypothetical protein
VATLTYNDCLRFVLGFRSKCGTRAAEKAAAGHPNGYADRQQQFHSFASAKETHRIEVYSSGAIFANRFVTFVPSCGHIIGRKVRHEYRQKQNQDSGRS